MSIRKHLQPQAKDAYTCLQVKMETAMVEEVKMHMKLDEVSWNDLLTACFRAYLDEARVAHADKLLADDAVRSKVGVTLVSIIVIITLMESPVFGVVYDLTDYLI